MTTANRTNASVAASETAELTKTIAAAETGESLHAGSADFHCDVLSKLLTHPEAVYNGQDSGILDVTRARLAEAGAALQVFAIYIPEALNGTMAPILHSIDLFYRKIAAAPRSRLIRTRKDLQAAAKEGRLGVMLSLEGVDGLQGDLAMLRILFLLGVRAVGLTWNYGNWAADGVMEERGGGFTHKGRLLMRECRELGLIVDVSHLAEKGFWEAADLTEIPLIASHSNARAVCGHPRNLTNDQIRALIAQDGLIGITFVPFFLRADGPARIDDVLRHIDHVCSLGGERQLMFGSDFDGIDTHVEGLASPADLWRLREALHRHYSEDQVRRFLQANTLRYLSNYLPG